MTEPRIDPALPKVELHLHLEGAAPPGFIRGLAKEKHLDISGIFDARGHYRFRDFPDFLKVYEAACTTLQSPQDFQRLTLAVMEQSARDGVIHTEAFLSPDFCGGGDPAAWREYLHAIQEAAQIAERTMGVTLRGVATCIRHFGPLQARRIALCAAETAGDFLTGFGMGGNEAAGNAQNFAYAFDMAREAGLRLTAHAGEWGGPPSVREVLEHLRVERIGHGVRAIEDPALVDRLAERGVKITLSTDDPPFFHTSNTAEYEALAHSFGWTEEDFRAINTDAAHAAFCDEDTRARILKRLEG